MTTARIPVGVEVERRPAGDGAAWSILRLRPGARSLPPWTILAEADGTTRFYAGTARLTLRAAEARRYAAHLRAEPATLTVTLAPAEAEPGWTLHSASLLGADEPPPGALVEALPIPPALRAWVAQFTTANLRPEPAPEPAPEPTQEPGFLDRWSRLKQGDRHAAPAPPPRPAPPATASDAPPDLPPLDSLRTRADYAAYLRAGAPAALRLAALRQAWASDPAIAGHKPLVDYDWNFNAPGYGRLLPADDGTKLADRLFRHLRERTLAGEPSAPRPEAGPAAPDEPPAVAESEDDPPSPPPRRHGGATPA